MSIILDTFLSELVNSKEQKQKKKKVKNITSGKY